MFKDDPGLFVFTKIQSWNNPCDVFDFPSVFTVPGDEFRIFIGRLADGGESECFPYVWGAHDEQGIGSIRPEIDIAERIFLESSIFRLTLIIIIHIMPPGIMLGMNTL